MPDVDAVIICASWDMHVEMCIEAMKAGKYVGCEVGGAYSLRECWKLIETYEETKVPVMFLENCLYGRDEMMVLNMAEQGVLGEIVHCEGVIVMTERRSCIWKGKQTLSPFQLHSSQYRKLSDT